jgi:rubrerythrin
MDWAEKEEEQQQDTAPAGSFGNLPTAFLQDVQTGLESLGYDLTSPDAMLQLATDTGLTERLLPLLTADGASSAIVIERIRQWQQAIQEQMEMEKQLKAKKQRPVWRCEVCGRYGCPVAPYIESYQEVDD